MKIGRIIVLVSLLIPNLVASAAEEIREHVVKRGETFEIIAQRYGIGVEILRELNPKVRVCYAGMKLQIPEELITTETTSLAEQLALEEVAAKGEKRSFWQKAGDIASSVGQIASIVGDVTVTAASTLSEAGLLDDMGNTGAYLGGVADVVNATKGVQSNFMAEGSRGRYSSDGSQDMSDDGSFDANDLAELKTLRASKERERDQLNSQVMARLSDATNTRGPKRGLTDRKKYNAVKNSDVQARINVLNSEISELSTRIAILEGTYEELQESRAENRRHVREAYKRTKQWNKDMRDNYYESRKVSTAKDIVSDIESKSDRTLDVIEGGSTADLYKKQKKIIYDHERRKNKKNK